MGNIVLGISTRIVYYFENLDRTHLDNLIQTEGSVYAAAQSLKLPVKLVVDIVTTAENIQGPQVNDFYATGSLVLEYTFSGTKVSYENIQKTIEIDLSDINSSFLSTNVIFTDHQGGSSVPIIDSNNDITAVPASEQDVPGKANDD